MRRFFSAALFALLLVPALPADQAHACSCMMQTPKEVFENADMVFRGRAVDEELYATQYEEGGYAQWENRFAFAIDTVYKGPLMNGVLVHSAKDSAACGVNFPLNTERIVAVYKDEDSGTYRASSCGSYGLDEETIKEFEDFAKTPYEEPYCVPYTCPDGVIIPSCDAEGNSVTTLEMCNDAPFGPFPDVSWDHPDREAIAYTKLDGYFKGNADGTFRPDSAITRAELVTVLFRRQAEDGVICEWPAEGRFSDVELGTWYVKTVCLARQAGIVKGYEDGTFRPHQAVTLAEAVKIILVNNYQYQYQADMYPSRERAAIADGKPWWTPYAEDIESFISIESFGKSPDKPATRAEVARILHEMWKGQNL